MSKIQLNYDVTIAASKKITSTTGTDGTVVNNTTAGAGGNYVTGKTVYDYIAGTDHSLLSSSALDAALKDGAVQLGAASGSDNSGGSSFYNINITDTAVEIRKGTAVIASFTD